MDEWPRRVGPILAIAVLCGCCVFLYSAYTEKAAPGWDPIAYKYAGEQLAAGRSFAYCHPYSAQFGPYFTLAGFNVRVDDGECLYLNYPIGFPVMLATAQRLQRSADAAWYVPAVLAAVGLLAVFSIGTALFDQFTGLLAAVVMAFTPTYLAFGTSLWSDLPGVAALITGLALYLRAEQTSATWMQWIWGVVGGLCVTLGLFTRYTTGVLLLPWVAYVLVAQRRMAFTNMINWVFGAVVAGGIVGILLFNRRYYGGYLYTPYSPRHGWYTWPAFSLRYVFGESPVGKQSLLATIGTIWGNFAWLLLPAGWGAIRMRAPQRVALLGSVLVVVGLSAIYAFPPQDVNTRFLLPAFPFLSLAAGYGLWRAAPVRWRWCWRGLGAAMVVIVLFIPLTGRLQGLADRNDSSASYVASIVRLVADSEPDAVFLAYNTNDAIAYYGQRTTLFYPRILPTANDTVQRSIEVPLVAVVDGLLEEEVPVYYVQDSDPPLGKSLAILNRHYRLSQLEEDGAVYRVLVADEYH